MDQAKIFVRERGKVGQGEKKPRFAVVGTVGTDLAFYAKHIRKMEVEEIASIIGAEVVYLEAGKDDEDDDTEE